MTRSAKFNQIVAECQRNGWVNPKTGKVLLPSLFNAIWVERDVPLRYEFAMVLANKYCQSQFGLGWDDLPDINTLDGACEVDTYEELVESVKEAVMERVHDGME